MTLTGSTYLPRYVSQKSAFSGYAADITAVLDVLKLAATPLAADGMTTGEGLVDWITENQIQVSFGATEENELGYHLPEYGEDSEGEKWISGQITISTSIQSNKYVCASVLAHEILHAVWWLDDYGPWWWLHTKEEMEYGTPPDGTSRAYNSIDQEYNAFVTGRQVWEGFIAQAIDVGTGENPGYGYDIEMEHYSGSESEAKEYIRMLYAEQELTEY
ncbi:MAG: hypothetical protein KTQ49_02455 [Candidatus Omnitrophica bacterium]|nr:hypothetical protein [Candidatus Omnitrophota bacterium]